MPSGLEVVFLATHFATHFATVLTETCGYYGILAELYSALP